MANLTKVTITISKPVEKAWELFMNSDNLKHWLMGFVSVEPVSGNAGEPGSVCKLKFMERGKLMEVRETVITAIPNQRYSFEMEHTAFHAKTDIRLAPFNGRTEFIQTVEVFPKSFMMKLMMPIVKGAMKKQMVNELIKLKNFIEAQP